MSDFASLRISEGVKSIAEGLNSHGQLIVPSKLSHQTKAFLSHRADEPRLDVLRYVTFSCVMRNCFSRLAQTQTVGFLRFIHRLKSAQTA